MSKSSNISGFPEFLPGDQIVFNRAISLIKHYFELSGFVPLDTPAVERTTTLLSKGGSDHEIYGIYRLAGEEGSNKKELALRFDLTVPLARYVAQHYGQLTFPYRRYHIAPVWRGERPQAGRYRQFYQCDIDIIGDGELSLIHDAEIPAIIFQIFKAMKIGKFTIRLNNKNILLEFIRSLGVGNEEMPAQVMRAIDKIEKITQQQLELELKNIGLSGNDINRLLDFITQRFTTAEWLSHLKKMEVNEGFKAAVADLEQVVTYMQILGVEDDCFVIDPTIARGLDYYTGTIYETRLESYPELGSICSGGRYANLAENFTTKKLPGVGISIGISRLIPKLIEAGILHNQRSTTADVLVTTQNPEYIPQYLQLCHILREHDINTEIYLQHKPLSNQMKYASKKGFAIVVIADKAELDQGRLHVKNLSTGEQTTCLKEDLVKVIKTYSW